ncbi:MAG TPA: hypothetical protein VK985_06005 [Rariglobus sp.]|nr:hypothetical protein [Rariglobus sp.]
MIKTSLRVLLLSATVLSASLWAAEPAAAPKEQKLLKVCTLNTAQANKEFQANVQLVQAQRQLAIEANAAFEKETDTKKKADLKKKLDALLAKLNENNQKMIKTYGFSLERSYTVSIEKADVYMLVTNEEAAKIEKAQAEAAKK